MELTIDFTRPLFQHSLLLISGIDGWQYPASMPEQKHTFHNFEVYIGNDPNYKNNPKCPGGPFMQWNDSQSKTTVQQTDSTG